ncbi:hypothetical protein FGG08_005046 [Glutinoglossum americanum]|uniref:Uncharacterized protein n=1 Tax=Glutinoglossum americanum TaxID=1670608 RepID=A0A9P8L1U1_9PEZI|nr:hypothetical protein FGG08_005046 [Glutinoglossum americanum]
MTNTTDSPVLARLRGGSHTSNKGSTHANRPHSTDLVRRIVINSAQDEAHAVIARLVKESTQTSAEVLGLLKELINLATDYDEQMAEIVVAAWTYIETHKLWDRIYASSYELQQVMNFKQIVEPILQRVRRYDLERMNLMKTITRRWRTVMAETIPADFRPKTMGRSLLTALCSLADRVPDHEEAVRLIRRQVACRIGEKPRRVQVVKTRDIQAIMDGFYSIDRMAIGGAVTDSADNRSEQSERSNQLEQSDQLGQTGQPEQSDYSNQSNQSKMSGGDEEDEIEDEVEEDEVEEDKVEEDKVEEDEVEEDEVEEDEVEEDEEDEVEEDEVEEDEVEEDKVEEDKVEEDEVEEDKVEEDKVEEDEVEEDKVEEDKVEEDEVEEDKVEEDKVEEDKVEEDKIEEDEVEEDEVEEGEVGENEAEENEVGEDKTSSGCQQYQAECLQFLSRIPDKLWMPYGNRMQLLKLARRVTWTKFCYRHIRVLAVNCAGLKNSSRTNKKMLIGWMNIVLHYHDWPYKLQRKFPGWFPAKVVPTGEVRKHLGPCMWKPQKPKAYANFQFDQKEIFNRFTRLFDYLVNDPQVFCLVEEEFNLYKHHQRSSAEDGDEPRGWIRHMFYSLTQQLVRQDPAYWAIVAAARPDQN